MKAKLNPVQRLRLGQAHDNLQTVIREMKAKPLEGKAIEAMQILEDSVNGIAAVLLITNGQ